eukprot:4637571-Pleurochrysis_carterae.AAC.1
MPSSQQNAKSGARVSSVLSRKDAACVCISATLGMPDGVSFRQTTYTIASRTSSLSNKIQEGDYSEHLHHLITVPRVRHRCIGESLIAEDDGNIAETFIADMKNLRLCTSEGQ